jgi:enolase 1/2/3
LPVIERLTGREILDSRGRPTVEATCALRGGAVASASVPSGASTGKAEALELRDGDPTRYRGLGCRKAAGHVGGPIHDEARGREFDNQTDFDRLLIELDGTPNKSRLGANAILAASIAFARASATEAGLPLWRQFANITGCEPSALPRLTINLFSGGKHAGQQVSIQDVLIVPVAATTIDQTLTAAYDVYQSAAALVLERYGMRLLRADEGGMAPPCGTPKEMIELALEAIEAAGYNTRSEVNLAVDVASTHFHSCEVYRLGDEVLTSDRMIEQVAEWVRSYPIVSVEDALAEDDWNSWPKLLSQIGDQALVVGDDLLCTNPARIRRAIADRSCNALLLKVNQIGTLTEAAEARRIARDAGWQVTISVRSGETEDNWAADLAVGWAGDQFKNGSITQSERLSKYNRLLQIENDTGLPVNPWPAK